MERKEIMPRKTKKQILDEAGYEPKRGRQSIADEPTSMVGVRLPISVIDQIPEPLGVTLRALIMRKYPAKSAPK
jgi:hypothetical protein